MSEANNSNEPQTNIPVDPNELMPQPSWVTGSAEQEEKRWDTLEETKLNNDRRWLVVYGWVITIMTCCFSAIFIAALLAWAWHYIGPSCYYWL
ncbi:MAG: hypothetical protein K8F30_12860 [Taibaiella sp.]|nr:hypothetical protein [Taibaiella sp.]